MSGHDLPHLDRDVSRETEERLAHLVALIEKWNPRINLIAKSTVPEIWTRHILDSAQLFDLAPVGAERWADLGSGGGFPGLVVAILAKAERPGLKATLVESDARKAAFLTTAVRELALNADVRAERIESLPPIQADVLSARALAPLATLLGHAERHLRPGGTALFAKGATHGAELAAALETWRFSYEKHPSKTDPRAVILSIEGIARV